METQEYAIIQLAQSTNHVQKQQQMLKDEAAQPVLAPSSDQEVLPENWSPQNDVVSHYETHLSATMFGGFTRNKLLPNIDQQQLFLRKSKLRMVIVFLAAATNFGNSFVTNSPAPLQQEIQDHMGINDSQFNYYYSLKSLSSIIPPILMATLAHNRLSVKNFLIGLSLTCAIGQGLFAIGISKADQQFCLVGRFFIGLSDALTVMQQTIMCLWFPSSQLPYAFGLMLFLVKAVRTTNDNFAPMFYNQIGLQSYFWLGFGVCLFSTFCSYILAQLHESVISGSSSIEVKQKQSELVNQRKDEIEPTLLGSIRAIPQQFWVFMVVDALGYSSIHAFYPNMPKFFQEKFDFSNTEAGTTASFPYLIASLSVPIFGSLIGRLGDTNFPIGILFSLCMLLLTHVGYLLLPEHLLYKWIAVVPILWFGLGHALFTTLLSPTVPLIVKTNVELLPICFSLLKIFEGISITLFTQAAGWVRQCGESYTYVTVLLLCCNLGAIFAAKQLVTVESIETIRVWLLTKAGLFEANKIKQIKDHDDSTPKCGTTVKSN